MFHRKERKGRKGEGNKDDLFAILAFFAVHISKLNDIEINESKFLINCFSPVV